MCMRSSQAGAVVAPRSTSGTGAAGASAPIRRSSFKVGRRLRGIEAEAAHRYCGQSRKAPDAHSQTLINKSSSTLQRQPLLRRDDRRPPARPGPRLRRLPRVPVRRRRCRGAAVPPGQGGETRSERDEAGGRHRRGRDRVPGRGGPGSPGRRVPRGAGGGACAELEADGRRGRRRHQRRVRVAVHPVTPRSFAFARPVIFGVVAGIVQEEEGLQRHHPGEAEPEEKEELQ